MIAAVHAAQTIPELTSTGAVMAEFAAKTPVGVNSLIAPSASTLQRERAERQCVPAIALPP